MEACVACIVRGHKASTGPSPYFPRVLHATRNSPFCLSRATANLGANCTALMPNIADNDSPQELAQANGGSNDETAIEQMIRACRHEKAAPELLRYSHHL